MNETRLFQETGFISKKKAEAIHDVEGADQRVIISMTSPNTKGCSPAVLDPKSWSKILQLEFHDIDPKYHSNQNTGRPDLVFFTEDHAYQIIKFLFETEHDHKQAVCHCEAGISRSAAVSKFIAQIYNLQFPESYHVYNKHIFSTLMTVYVRCSYGEGEIPANRLPGWAGHEARKEENEFFRHQAKLRKEKA